MADKLTFIAELKDLITGPSKKAAKAAGDLGKSIEGAGKDAEKSYGKAGKAAEHHAQRTTRSTSKVERALEDLTGSTRRVGQVWQETWRDTEKGSKRAAEALSTSGRQMVTESRQIGDRVGANLRDGIQSGIDSIDVSGLATTIGGLTVGGGIWAALDRDAEARRVAASVGSDPAAIRDLVEDAYYDNYGTDYNAVANNALSVVGTFDLDPGSPEAEALLRGNATMEQAFGLDPNALTMAVKIMADTDDMSFTEAQGVLAEAMQNATPMGRDEMLDNLQEYIPLLNDTGISATALTAMLSGATGRGAMASDKTADAIKEFTLRAVDTANPAYADAYASLGLDQSDVSRRLQSGDATAFTDVTQALAGVPDQAEQARLAVEIFGTPMEDLGVGNIDEQIDAWTNLDMTISGADGTLGKMQDTMGEGPGADWSRAMRDLSGAMVDVGDAVAPIISGVAPIISLLAKPIAWGATGLTLFGIISRIPGGAKAAKWALSGLWKVAATNPFTWVVGAIWGLGELYDHVDWVKTAFDTVTDAIRDVVEWFDTLLGRADEWMGKKLGIENPGDSTIIRDSVSHAVTGGPSRAFFENNGLSTDDEAGWPEWMKRPEAWANRVTGIGDDKVHGEGLFRFLHGAKPPAHADGGWTASGAHLATVGEEGREFVVNHWASEKLASVPGALGAISQGRVPVAPVPVGGGSPVVVEGDTVQVTIYDARDANAVAQQVAAALAARDRDKRLTYATPTARGAR